MACVQTLDELALSLPAKHVLPGALGFVARAMSAPEPHARFAACTIIVCVAEGCAEAVRRHMADVLQVVPTALSPSRSFFLQAVQDAHACRLRPASRVRGRACMEALPLSLE